MDYALPIMMVATAFNAIIIIWKFKNDRYLDGILDSAILVAFAVVFGGTLGGMSIATGASALVSLYLLISPPKFAI